MRRGVRRGSKMGDVEVVMIATGMPYELAGGI